MVQNLTKKIVHRKPHEKSEGWLHPWPILSKYVKYKVSNEVFSPLEFEINLLLKSEMTNFEKYLHN